MRSQKQPDATDTHVGSTVRNRRLVRGMSQETLAQHCGVSFQQIQKYERGANRISASMLVRITKALKCKAGDMFPDNDAETTLDPAQASATIIAGRFHGIQLLKHLSVLPEGLYRAVVDMADGLARHGVQDPGLLTPHEVRQSSSVTEVSADHVAALMREGGLRVDVIAPSAR
jgi:transcriptional regulator with XRE-family HTH domain